MWALLPTIIAVALGGVVGLVLGGRLRHLRQWRPASPEAAGGGLLALVLAEVLPGPDIGVLLLELVGVAALIYVAWSNRRVGGMIVVLVGLGMNLVPTLLNGGTPVSPQALVEAGLAKSSTADRLELSGPRHLRDTDDLVPALGDTIALPFPAVVSLGDLVICAGLALVTQSILRRRQVRPGVGRVPGVPGGPGADQLPRGLEPVILEGDEPPGTGKPSSGNVRTVTPGAPPDPAAGGSPTVRVIPPSAVAAPTPPRGPSGTPRPGPPPGSPRPAPEGDADTTGGA